MSRAAHCIVKEASIVHVRDLYERASYSMHCEI